MNLFVSESLTPPLHFALEQHLFHDYRDNFFMLYRNMDSVIIGKNQNIFQECDINFCEKNMIEIYRRMSGGGAVFHDMGNINFSFIITKDKDSNDIYSYLNRVLSFLRDQNIDVKMDANRSMYIDKKKISGTALYNRKDRFLLHGTLLFSTDLDKMKLALRPTIKEVDSKAIKSKRVETTNISEYIDMDITKFIDDLAYHVCSHNNSFSLDSKSYSLIYSKYLHQFMEEKIAMS